MKKKISPDRIVNAVKENFKGILSKPLLKNLILVTLAIALTDKLKINEIARKLPLNVKHQKSKQNRFLRYLDKPFPILDMMFSWTKFVLQKLYENTEKDIIILIDKVGLIHGYKAFVSAIPFRKRAIPIAFKIYTDQQIDDMVYRSENEIIWNFIDFVHESIKRVFPDKREIFVFDRGFADEKLIRYLELMGVHYVMRVPKNSGISTMGYRGKLSEFGHCGYFRDVSYHLTKQIKTNLLCKMNDIKPEDPIFIISDIEEIPDLIYRKRMDIEEGFRDLKTLFGFKQLVLKKLVQERIEILLLLVIISMGLLFLLFEKSGYRWSKYYNTSCRKEFSLIHVIKDKIRDSWIGLCINPFFSLHSAVFYRV